MYSVSLMAGSSSFAFQIHCDTFFLDNNVGDRIFLALVRLNKHVQSMYKKNIFFLQDYLVSDHFVQDLALWLTFWFLF